MVSSDRFARIHLPMPAVFPKTRIKWDIEFIFPDMMTIYMSESEFFDQLPSHGRWKVGRFLGEMDWEYFELKNLLNYGPGKRREKEEVI